MSERRTKLTNEKEGRKTGKGERMTLKFRE
jgi:hypothetical protein